MSNSCDSGACGGGGSGWACALCLQPLRSACVTTACGHGFHEACAALLQRSRGSTSRLECPECDDEEGDGGPSAAGEAWRTFWADTPESSASTPSATASAPEPLAAPVAWRRVSRRAARVEALAREAAAAREALASERRQLARHAALDAGLRRDIAHVRAQLDACRVRSLSAVVAHGAAQCHAQLAAAAGEMEYCTAHTGLWTTAGHTSSARARRSRLARCRV